MEEDRARVFAYTCSQTIDHNVVKKFLHDSSNRLLRLTPNIIDVEAVYGEERHFHSNKCGL